MTTFVAAGSVRKAKDVMTTVCTIIPYAVEANNQDEAYGRAMRILTKLYPISEYHGHYVVVTPLLVIDPENAVLIKNK